jgi:proline iminopeptidase
MRVAVGGVRLWIDVDGAKLVPEGPWMRERPTVVMLHPGPGFDHGLFKVHVGPWLAAGAQVVYLDMRGAGRSDHGPPEEHTLDRWAEDVHELCRALRIERPIMLGIGFGTLVALRYAARHASEPAALVLAGPVARIDPERSVAVYERLGGEEAREVAERFYGAMDDHDFADFVRVCFPLLSSYAMTSEVIARANWTPEVLMRWMAGEAKALDLRPELPGIGTPVLVLAGEDDAWAPLESAREVADLLPDARFRSFVRGRHSIFRDAPESYEELRLFLDEVRAGEGMA